MATRVTGALELTGEQLKIEEAWCLSQRLRSSIISKRLLNRVQAFITYVTEQNEFDLFHRMQ